MTPHPEMPDDEDVPRAHRRRRRSAPRFGPLLTIAVAMLMLFGAVSRLGKPQPLGEGLLGSLDLSAKARLDQDRVRSEEERLRTLVSIGAAPSSSAADTGRRTAADRPDQHPLPPVRGDFDLEEYLRGGETAGAGAPETPAGRSATPGLVTLSIAGEVAGNGHRAPRFDPAPEAVPDAGSGGGQKTYTVQPGDNWVKVAERTGKRWQDVQKANPSSSGGLRVGMKLVIP